MAEGLLNALYGDRYQASSAGVTPTKINPFAVKAMAEIGIDISENRSKSIEEFRGEKFHYVVTVCDSARETCPFFPGETIVHKAFEDPSQFRGSEEDMLKKVRRVREEIKEWIEHNFAR